MVSKAERLLREEHRRREMDLVDRAPQHIRTLIHEFEMSAVVQAIELVGMDETALRKLLDANRRREQEKVLRDCARTGGGEA